MRAPELTYGYTSPKDTQGQQLAIFNQGLSISGGAAASLQLEFNDLPKDRILIMNNMVAVALPGATQTVSIIQFSAFTATRQQYDLHILRPVTVADRREILQWDGEAWITGGGDGTNTLRILAIFNAFANANTLTVSWSGLIIPRGSAGAF